MSATSSGIRLIAAGLIHKTECMFTNSPLNIRVLYSLCIVKVHSNTSSVWVPYSIFHALLYIMLNCTELVQFCHHRAMCGWRGGHQDAQVLSVWGHGQHSLQDGVHQSAWVWSTLHWSTLHWFTPHWSLMYTLLILKSLTYFSSNMMNSSII